MLWDCLSILCDRRPTLRLNHKDCKPLHTGCDVRVRRGLHLILNECVVDQRLLGCVGSIQRDALSPLHASRVGGKAKRAVSKLSCFWAIRLQHLQVFLQKEVDFGATAVNA